MSSPRYEDSRPLREEFGEKFNNLVLEINQALAEIKSDKTHKPSIKKLRTAMKIKGAGEDDYNNLLLALCEAIKDTSQKGSLFGYKSALRAKLLKVATKPLGLDHIVGESPDFQNELRKNVWKGYQEYEWSWAVSFVKEKTHLMRELLKVEFEQNYLTVLNNLVTKTAGNLLKDKKFDDLKFKYVPITLAQVITQRAKAETGPVSLPQFNESNFTHKQAVQRLTS